MSGQVILGTGRRADSPYYMERFYVNLYSVEELCFLFVDREIGRASCRERV